MVRPVRQKVSTGCPSVYLAKPSNADELVEVMREAAERRETVVARGAGTKLDWGLPPSKVDLLVDLSAMDHVLEHSAGDLIVRAEPGVRLSELQRLLAGSGQRLAIDEVVPGSTIGGLVATGLCGPMRLAYGCVRDLLIGVRVVRADGVAAKSGGKVVKNVAGYDLGKLYTGSYGTLGIVAEAVFRLHPVPESRAWVTAQLSSEVDVVRAIAAVTSSQVVPTALEINRAPGARFELSVLVEGIALSVDHRGQEVARLLGGDFTIAPSPPPWWATLPEATTMKLATTVSDIPLVLSAIAQSSANRGLRAEPARFCGARAALCRHPRRCRGSRLPPRSSPTCGSYAKGAEAVHSCYGRHEMSKMSSMSGVRSGRSSS